MNMDGVNDVSNIGEDMMHQRYTVVIILVPPLQLVLLQLPILQAKPSSKNL